MSLFESSAMDATLLVLLGLIVLKTIFKDKNSIGLKLLLVGGLFLLIETSITSLDWSYLGLMAIRPLIGLVLAVIGAVFVAIACLKLIFESFSA